MSGKEDIVTRLRMLGGLDAALCNKAADEIERLRTQLEMWQDGNIMAESHHEEINRLRADKEKCHEIMESQSHQLASTARQIRELRDELVKNADEFRETLTELRQRVETLTAERDEARRMYCKAVADHYEYVCNAELDGAGPYTQKDAAKDEGWDCFKEDGK